MEAGKEDVKHLRKNHVDYEYESLSTSSEEEVSFWQDFVAGGVAGSASVVVGHPFDTIKVRRKGDRLIVSCFLFCLLSSLWRFTHLQN